MRLRCTAHGNQLTRTTDNGQQRWWTHFKSFLLPERVPNFFPHFLSAAELDFISIVIERLCRWHIETIQFCIAITEVIRIRIPVYLCPTQRRCLVVNRRPGHSKDWWELICISRKVLYDHQITYQVHWLANPVVMDAPTVKLRPCLNEYFNLFRRSLPSWLFGKYAMATLLPWITPGLSWYFSCIAAGMLYEITSVSHWKPEQRMGLLDTVIVPEGDFPCGPAPTGIRQTGHCGLDLKASLIQLLWKTWLHNFSATQPLFFSLSWQIAQSSFILQDAGGAMSAFGETPVARLRGAVYCRLVAKGFVECKDPLAWTARLDTGNPAKPADAKNG